MATDLDRLCEELKHGGYLRRYLEDTGRKVLSGGQLSCPNKSAHPNGDKNPSAHLYEDSTGDHVYCFGCGDSWDIFAMVKLDEGLEFMDAARSLAKRFGLRFPDIKKKPGTISARAAKPSVFAASSPMTNEKTDTLPPAERPDGARKYLEECAARIGETDYFTKRGISIETAKRLGCGFDPSHYFPSLHDRRAAVVFPASRGWAARAVGEKAHSFLKGMVGGSAFNLEALEAADKTSAVFIVEGQFDALSVEEVGGHALALGGVQHVEELVKRVKARRLTFPLIVALDREDNPQKAATVATARARLERELREAGAFVYHLNEPAFDAHDANDALLADRKRFTEDVRRVAWLASEAYMLRDEEPEENPEEEKPGKWAAKTRTFADIPEPVPEEENPRALFKRGFLRKGHGLCLVSCAGVGKSVISLQLALAWALGRPCLGLEPVRPLRIGVFTFEDDDEDNADFRRDYREGFRREGLTDAEIDRALAAIDFIDIEGCVDEGFVSALADIQLETPRDLYIVNPLSAVMSEYDLSDNTSANNFFRNIVDPVIKGRADKRTECALMIVAHTGKVPKGAKEREGFMRGTFAQYDIKGASAFMDWTRASLMIAPTSSTGDFVLLGAKRQSRLGWKDADGKPTNERYISYSPDIKFWIPTPEDRVRKLLEDNKSGPKPASDPKQDAARFAESLRSLTSGVPLTNARKMAQDQFGQARGNAAFTLVTNAPNSYGVNVEKVGKTTYIGGVGLGIGANDPEPPQVDGLEDY